MVTAKMRSEHRNNERAMAGGKEIIEVCCFREGFILGLFIGSVFFLKKNILLIRSFIYVRKTCLILRADCFRPGLNERNKMELKKNIKKINESNIFFSFFSIENI